MPDQPRQLCELRTYQDLIATLRARRDELNLPHLIIDEITGLSSGYFLKMVSPQPIKLIGPTSWNVFEALGLRVIVVEDKAALERTMRRSAWRTRRQFHPLPACRYPQQE